MAQPNIKVMISSRCAATKLLDESGKEVTLSDARKEWKAAIEQETYLGRKIATVWINEEEVGAGEANAWEECLQQASTCDIFVSIFDGSAGWQDKRNPGIGICHAEFDAAFGQAPQKVSVIKLANAKATPGPDLLFLDALTKAKAFEKVVANKADKIVKKADLTNAVKQVVREMVLRLAHAGAAELKRSGPNVGQALDWSRMNFQQRAKAIKSAINEALNSRPGSTATNTEMTLVELDNVKLAMVPHAIPAAFGISAAKEMTGQPFLRDHEIVSQINKTFADAAGPVHIIGCSKTVTEAQAVSLLGFPDATIVPGSFGIYVADNVQKIQMCLVANCRDAASTVHGVQRMFEWLERSGEQEHLIRRAKSRRKIVDAVMAEM